MGPSLESFARVGSQWRLSHGIAPYLDTVGVFDTSLFYMPTISFSFDRPVRLLWNGHRYIHNRGLRRSPTPAGRRLLWVRSGIRRFKWSYVLFMITIT
jgi:hypothetical protein